ncbi:hypothetical protein ABLN97_10000 [Mycobacterium tuberculosis]
MRACSNNLGLPDHAGDLLEDLGYDRRQVLQRLKPCRWHRFESAITYTFGVTAAAEAVRGRSRPVLGGPVRRVLYRRWGWGLRVPGSPTFWPSPTMRSTTSRSQTDGRHYQRDPDAQSPADGVSSSLNDMTHWLAMVLADGVCSGRRITSPEARSPSTRRR